jgi:hypothetical protein
MEPARDYGRWRHRRPLMLVAGAQIYGFGRVRVHRLLYPLLYSDVYLARQPGGLIHRPPAGAQLADGPTGAALGRGK